MSKLNDKRKKEYEQNFAKVKQIITGHHTKSPKKIKAYLLSDFGIRLGDSTINRYLATIVKQNKKEIAKKNKKISKKIKKPESIKPEFPYYIKDPSGKEHKITGDNMTITLGWGNSGRLITFDTKAKIWRYDNNGRPFNKNDKPKPFFKTHSNNSFEFSDI